MSLWVLLGTLLFFVLIIWIGQLRMSGRLRRIESQLTKGSTPQGTEERAARERNSEDKEQYLLFKEFIDEDPSRNDLPKKEQFAAFRKWRSDKGLNWSAEANNGGDPA